MRCGRKVMRRIFYLPKFLFFQTSMLYPSIVPLGSYTPKEALFPFLVAALEVFDRCGFQMSVTQSTKLFFYKDDPEKLRKWSFTWDQILQTNGCSVMTTPHVTLPSPSQNVRPQKSFLWFPILWPQPLWLFPFFFLNLKMSSKDVISGL